MSNLDHAVRWIQSIGKCGSLSAKSSICTRTANHDGNHRAEQMGGVRDGYIFEEWPW